MSSPAYIDSVMDILDEEDENRDMERELEREKLFKEDLNWKKPQKRKIPYLLPRKHKVDQGIYTIDTSDLLKKTRKKNKQLLDKYEEMKTVDDLYNKLPKHIRDELEIRKGGAPRNAEKRLFLNKKTVREYKRKVLPRKTKKLFTWGRPRGKDAKYTKKMREERDRLEQLYEKEYLKNPFKPPKKKLQELKKLRVTKEDGLDDSINATERAGLGLERFFLLSRDGFDGFERRDFRRTEPESKNAVLQDIIIKKIKKNLHPPAKIMGYSYIREQSEKDSPNNFYLLYRRWDNVQLRVKLNLAGDEELKNALKKWREYKTVIFQSIRDKHKPPDKIMDMKYECCADKGDHLIYFTKWGREFKVELPRDVELQNGLKKWREDYIRKSYLEDGTLKRSSNDLQTAELEHRIAKETGRKMTQVKSTPPQRRQLTEKEIERKVKNISKGKKRTGNRRFFNKEIEPFDKKEAFKPIDFDYDSDDEPLLPPPPRRVEKVRNDEIDVNLQTWENLLKTGKSLEESLRLPTYEKILNFIKKLPEGMSFFTSAEKIFPNLPRVKDMLKLLMEYDKNTQQERMLVDKIAASGGIGLVPRKSLRGASGERGKVNSGMTPTRRERLQQDLLQVQKDVDSQMLSMKLPRQRRSQQIKIDNDFTLDYFEKDDIKIRYTPRDNWHFYIPEEQDYPFVAREDEERYGLPPGFLGRGGGGGSGGRGLKKKFWNKWKLLVPDQKKQKFSEYKAMKEAYEKGLKEGEEPDKMPSFGAFIVDPFSTRIERLHRKKIFVHGDAREIGSLTSNARPRSGDDGLGLPQPPPPEPTPE
ncbi:MAG: hypothetical protein CMB64_03210 [Euryarchaeota archaeon]|nr:hypothetical protein [Euryarchaeota archaeon]